MRTVVKAEFIRPSSKKCNIQNNNGIFVQKLSAMFKKIQYST